MSKLKNLLSVQPASDKASVKECAELEELTSKKVPEEIGDILQTKEGLIQCYWIIEKRDNKKLTVDEAEREIAHILDPEAMGNMIWQIYYMFSDITRDAWNQMREQADKAAAEGTAPEVKTEIEVALEEKNAPQETT